MNYWITKMGEKIAYKKLSDSHLLSILNGEFAPEPDFTDLVKEAERRGLNTRSAKEANVEDDFDWRDTQN